MFPFLGNVMTNTGLTGLAILLSDRSCRRLLEEQWLLLFHLLGPVLLGCCQLKLTSLSCIIVLQPPLLCGGWDDHFLCLFRDGSVPMDLRWPLLLYSAEQYSVHQFSTCRSSLRHFPERSWTVVAFPCFMVVKSFTSWYALLLLFFLRFSSISLHCSPVQFSLAFFMHLLILQVQIVLAHFSPFVSQIKNLYSDPGSFLLTMFAKDLTGCFNHCCVVIIESRSVSSLFMMVRGANFLPIIAWKVSNTLGSFSFSMSNLSLLCFGLLILFRWRWKVIISKSWSLPMCAPGNFVFWQCSLLVRSAALLECNQSGCGDVHLDYARSIFWMLCDDHKCWPTQGR